MSAVARRYAKALFSLAQDQGQIEATGEQILAAAAELALPELAELANSPRLSIERCHSLVGAVAEQLSLSPLVSTFLLLLADHHRLRQLTGIAARFQELQDEALGRLRMTIRSATLLPEATREQIAAAFGRQLQRTVIATSEVDPSLLGGLVVAAEGKVYDGSVRSQLERLAKQMAHSDSH